MFKSIFSAVLVAFCVLASGCALQQSSPDVYRGMEVMRRGDAEQVTVVRIRHVTITGDDGYLSASSGMPGIIGAGISAFLGGRSIGNGNGRYVAGAVSGAVGGVITQQVSQVLNKRPGVEVIVRTDSGRTLVITQDAAQQFVAGERLYMLTSATGYRLTR